MCQVSKRNKKEINRSDQNITTVSNKRKTTASPDDGWMKGERKMIPLANEKRLEEVKGAAGAAV